MRRPALITLVTILSFGLAAASPLSAQEGPKKSTEQQAEDIAVQPVKDVGVVKTKIPPLLLEAAEDVYTLKGLSRCDQIGAAYHQLNGALGSDFVPGGFKANKGKIRINGDTVAGLIVPFRGIVREVSGAAEAQRELAAAIAAGIARRGFLRGVYQGRRCKPVL
jgi:hypothetical protein